MSTRMSFFRRLKKGQDDLAMLISDRLREQQKRMRELEIYLANSYGDPEDDQQVKQQLNRITLEFEINQHRLGIVLKSRELQALSEV